MRRLASSLPDSGNEITAALGHPLAVGRYRKHLLTTSLYAFLTILLTYPVFFQLSSHIAGFAGEDNLQWRWFLWWFKHAILTLQSSVTNVSILYAPTGGEQPLYAITTFIPALALPVTLLGGPTISFNISFLLSFILSGYTAYLLAYYLTRRHLAAFLGGFIFAFYPARFGYATGTFLGQLTTYFLPLYVLALFMLARRPTWARAIWAALVLTGLCLTWPLHVAYGVLIFTLPFLIWQLVIWLRRPSKRDSLKYFALAFGLAFLLIIGPYFPLFESAWQGQQYYLNEGNSVNMAIDLLAFISPSNYHPVLKPLGLLPEYVQHVLADKNDIQERLAYIGITAFLLSLLGLVKFWRHLLFWLVVAVAAMTLSLGPLLKFDGSLVQSDIEGYVGYVVLPYALLRSLPILDWSEVLGRLNVATMLCVAVMAAFGAGYLLSQVSTSRQPGLAVILAAFILFEFLTIFPFPTEPDQVPGFYYQLRQEAAVKPQVIIDLPLAREPVYNNYSMYYQTVHQQPLAGGHFMREPAGVDQMRLFLSQLLRPPFQQPALTWPDAKARLGLLNRFGFTKVVARLWFMTDEESKTRLAYLSTWLGQPQMVGDVAVFEVPEGGAPSGIISLLDAAGWQPDEANSYLQLQAPADLLVYIDEGVQQPVSLRLALFAPDPERYLSIDLDGHSSIRLYLSQETLSYNIPLWLQPGVHQLTFRPEEACQLDCAPVNFTHIAFDSSVANHTPSVTFGHRLTLADYQISDTTAAEEQPVLVYLYWQGHGQLDEDYSAFLHLVSPAGQIVSQADYLLGGWLDPTSNWSGDYIFAMPSLFFIPPEAAPGDYQLQVGLYNTKTGERLPVDADTGQDFILLSSIAVRP